MKRILFSIIAIFILNIPIKAQFVDSFSDGDFSLNPKWLGDTLLWQITGGQLHNNGPAVTGTELQLYTSSTLSVDCEWTFFANPKLATSSGNFMDIYLTSDSANLKGNGSGYFVRIGGLDDEISLFVKQNGTSTKIIDGANVLIASSSNNPVNVRVQRSAANVWTLERDYGLTGTYTTEGTVTNAAVTGSTYFGVYVKYSSANNTKYFFDDFAVGNIVVDVTAPDLQSATVLSSASIELDFDENVELSSSQTTSNYLIDNVLNNPATAVRNSTDNSKVILTFSGSFVSAQTYYIKAVNIADLNGNSITTPDSVSFVYTAPFMAQKGDIVLNEIFPDPTPVVGLPEKEFIELFNTTTQPISLQGFTIADPSSTVTLGNYVLPDSAYVILCANADTADFKPFGAVLGLSSLPSLNNAGDVVTLKSPQNVVIDEINYSLSWYQDAAKDDGGWTIERINPFTPCTGADNWAASVDTDGGTPGIKNSIYNTTPDTQLPSVLSAIVASPFSISITFSENMDSVSMVNATYSVSGLTVQTKTVTSLTQVTVNFTAPIDTGTIYTVVVAGATDCIGNALSAADSAQFGIGKTPDKNELIINEIFADESPVVGLPSAEYVEIFNAGNTLLDLSNCQFADASTTAALPQKLLKPGEYIILTSSTTASLFGAYGTVVSPASWPSLNNAGDELSLYNATGIRIDYLNYELSWFKDSFKEDGGWSLERINPFTPCSGPDNWIASNNFDGGTPGTVNSVFSTAPDNIAPSLLSAQVLSGTSVLLSFSEDVDTLSAKSATYTINNGLLVSSVKMGNAQNEVILTTSTIQQGTIYTVTVTGVTDCPGNAVSSNTAEFGIGETPGKFDLVINELFPDESPVVGLPEAEFIEIYNKSSKLIQLDSCKLSDMTSVARLGSAILKPGDYLILCATSDVSAYSAYGKTLGVSSIPSLNNADDKITISNKKGEIVHRVEYSDSWYGNANKQDGGWTLEMIDPANPCAGSTNWKASENSAGGTPGARNSVYAINPDITAPSVTAVSAENDSLVYIVFSEPVDSVSAVNASYTFSNAIQVQQLNIDFSTITIKVTPKLLPKTAYSLSISGISDCLGNISSSQTFNFFVPEQGDTLDVVINEVLFNPRTGGVDFVEVYNRSDKTINLRNWALATTNDTAVVNIKTVLDYTYTLLPKSYAVFTTDTLNIKNNYPAGISKTYVDVPSMPSYNDDAGTVVLMNNLLKITDSFTYSESYHFSLIDDKNGVSLERINTETATNAAANWHSASATSGYATPGYKNSQSGEAGTASPFSIEPRTFSPDDNGYRDYTLISYVMEKPGYTANISIYDANNRLVKNLVISELLGIEGVYKWDGLNNENLKANVGLYTVFLEVFDLSGKIKRYRESVAIGADF